MLTRIASSIVIATGMATGALAAAGAANALSAQDVLFLNDLRDVGFTVEYPAQAVTNAKLICGELAGGGTFSSVEGALASVETALTATDVVDFVNSAVFVYCPEQFAAAE